MRMLYQLAIVAVIALAGVSGWVWLDGRTAGGDARPDAGGEATPVEVVSARTGVVRDTVTAVGTTLARESVDIVAEVAGRVAAIRFEEGQLVDAGDVLFELDRSREEAELREAIAQRDDARAKYERARALRRDDNVSQAQVDELAALLEGAEARVSIARGRVNDRLIRAPFAGITGLREVSLGAYVAPGTRLTTLDDLSVVRIDFAVPERFLASLRPGLTVEARNVAFLERTFDGEVGRIGTRIDPVTRAVRVQSEFDNSEGLLRPGMFMTVNLVIGQRDNAVLVPEEALMTQGQSTYAFVIADERARRVDVTIGQRRAGLVEVLDGVSKGEQVVIAGLQRVRDGGMVRLVNEGDTSAMAARWPPEER